MKLQALVHQTKAQGPRADHAPLSQELSDFKANFSSYLNTQWASVGARSHSALIQDSKQVPIMEKDNHTQPLERLISRRRPVIKQAPKEQDAPKTEKHKAKEDIPPKNEASPQHREAPISQKDSQATKSTASDEVLQSKTPTTTQSAPASTHQATGFPIVSTLAPVDETHAPSQQSDFEGDQFTRQSKTASVKNEALTAPENVSQAHVSQHLPNIAQAPQTLLAAANDQSDLSSSKEETIDTALLSTILTPPKSKEERIIDSLTQPQTNAMPAHGITILEEAPSNPKQDAVDQLLKRPVLVSTTQDVETPTVKQELAVQTPTSGTLQPSFEDQSKGSVENQNISSISQIKEGAKTEPILSKAPLTNLDVTDATAESPKAAKPAQNDQMPSSIQDQNPKQVDLPQVPKSEKPLAIPNSLLNPTHQASHITNSLGSLKDIAEAINSATKPAQNLDTLLTKIEGLPGRHVQKPSLEQLLSKQGLTKTQASQKAIETISVTISHKATLGVKRFDIRLDPPELGRLDVRLDFGKDGANSAHILVERGETLDLLQRDRASLERALQQAGLDLKGSDLSFSLSKDQSQQGEKDEQAQKELGAGADGKEASDLNDPNAKHEHLIDLIDGIDLKL